MLVLAMEFSRGSPAVAPQTRRARRGKRAVGAVTAIVGGAPTSPEEPRARQARRRSLKTEQRCPPVLAAPYRRPMVYDRRDVRTTE
jgi:hypothetical protein